MRIIFIYPLLHIIYKIFMKQNGRKGLSLPMEIIIGVVVLVVIALAVIMFTSGSITKTGTQTTQTQTATSSQINCNSEMISYCGTEGNAATCVGGGASCPSCPSGVTQKCSLINAN